MRNSSIIIFIFIDLTFYIVLLKNIFINKINIQILYKIYIYFVFKIEN